MKHKQAAGSKEDFERDAGGTGTAFGIGGGAVIGGVLGSLAGPGGTVVGALAGAAAGGAVGHIVGAGGWADSNDEAYWRENLPKQSFYEQGFNYEDYANALRLGYHRYPDLEGRSYEETESRLGEEWERVKGNSRLTWEQARHATRAAWERMEERVSRSG